MALDDKNDICPSPVSPTQAAGLHEEEVEVDKEALVKILARYPGTFDVLRELVQNADDAGAHNIEIHFLTKEPEKSQPAGEPDVSKLKVHKWIIKNDGKPFEDKDWEKIGKIAHGNDDSSKVGAFGVGFYSVLSKSDRPVVKSNGKSMQFHKGTDNKLYMLFSDCPKDSWTSVDLELLQPESLPVLADLTRFLVSSVAFLTNINTFSVYLDSERVLRVEKKVELQVEIPIPEHLKPTTPEGTLIVKSIQHTTQRIMVDAKESAFASLASPSPVVATDDALQVSRDAEANHPTHSSQSADVILNDNAITHDLYTAETSVNLDSRPEMKSGVEANMKKPPPKFECKAVYFNSEQYDSLIGIKNSDEPKAKHLARLLFGSQGIVPENDGGRLFIGQSTNQTTGIGLHISAHFLPTMERGSIDLTNGQVAAWNKEVLCVGGFLARIIYEREMDAAKSKGGQLATKLGLDTMARFAFGLTVPHIGVSKLLQDAFFSCCHEPKSPFPVVSDVGISSVSDPQFRQNNKDLLFLKKYRVLDERVEPRQHTEIISRYGVPLFKFDDIVREFRSGVKQEAMKPFFAWWDDLHKNPRSSTEETRHKFCMKFASQGVLNSNHGRVELKNIKHFTFFPIPDDISHPNSLYVEVSQVPTKDAVECFGWTQLSLLDWLQYVCSQERQPASDEGSGQVPDVGYRILRVLVQFALVERLSPEQWNEVAELMKGLKCIPTDKGLQLPADSYFDEAAVCRSLPVVRETSFLDILPTPVAIDGGFEFRSVDVYHVQHVLNRIHVREEMDWEDMVRRLAEDASEESNYRLLQYVINRSGPGKMTNEQIIDLKTKDVFFSKDHGRVSADEILFPDEDTLELELPILALLPNHITSLQNMSTSSGSSAMETVIKTLGIQKHPTLKNIIDKAASDKPEVRGPAFRYLLSNLDTRYSDYKPENFAEKAFIPTKDESHACLNEVFASPIWETLGFKQPPDNLRRDTSRLGVKEDPSVEAIIACLDKPERRPSNVDAAAALFKYLHEHGNLSVSKLQEQLSSISFVPVKDLRASPSESPSIKHICPKDCFVKSAETKEHHCNIFPIVNFGQNGNGFLEFCRARKSLDASDIIGKILENPEEYLKALQNDTDLYLEDLRTIASRLDSIPADARQKMKKARMFLAFRNGNAANELLPAELVPIGDWAGRDFVRNVSVAPEEDILKKMYREMGSVFLGTYVRHDIVPHPLKAQPKFDRNQVILRIKCFMQERRSMRTDVSFYDEVSPKFRLKACKSVKLTKTFAPPYGVLADDTGTSKAKPERFQAGFQIGETDESYTLWITSDCSTKLYNHIAEALCHVLLKTYGPNDVMLLSSLFATSEQSLEENYNETKPDLSYGLDNEVKSEHKNQLLEKVRTLKPRRPPKPDDDATLFGDDNEKAMASWGKLDRSGNLPDFTGPCQSRPSKPEHNHECKQDYRIRHLIEEEEVEYGEAKIKFFMACGSRCPQESVPEDKKIGFAEIVSRLAAVFGLDASTSCCIFWDNTDQDLMAFNHKNLIYLNLAHYCSSLTSKDGDSEKTVATDNKKVVTEWYVIMAHEIVHNVAMEHDEYHGSLSTRLAIERFPTLKKEFDDISWEIEQQPESKSN